MLSRIMWISVAGIALIAGIAFQDGGRIFSWGHDDASARAERSIEDRVDRVIDRSFDRMQVVGPDGVEVDVPAETKRALAGAVGRLVKAETDLALLKMGDSSDEEMEAARARIADARADIDRLKAQIKGAEQAAATEQKVLAEEIKREVREDVRATIREAVRN